MIVIAYALALTILWGIPFAVGWSMRGIFDQNKRDNT